MNRNRTQYQQNRNPVYTRDMDPIRYPTHESYPRDFTPQNTGSLKPKTSYDFKYDNTNNNHRSSDWFRCLDSKSKNSNSSSSSSGDSFLRYVAKDERREKDRDRRKSIKNRLELDIIREIIKERRHDMRAYYPTRSNERPMDTNSSNVVRSQPFYNEQPVQDRCPPRCPPTVYTPEVRNMNACQLTNTNSCCQFANYCTAGAQQNVGPICSTDATTKQVINANLCQMENTEVGYPYDNDCKGCIKKSMIIPNCPTKKKQTKFRRKRKKCPSKSKKCKPKPRSFGNCQDNDVQRKCTTKKANKRCKQTKCDKFQRRESTKRGERKQNSSDSDDQTNDGTDRKNSKTKYRKEEESPDNDKHRNTRKNSSTYKSKSRNNDAEDLNKELESDYNPVRRYNSGYHNSNKTKERQELTRSERIRESRRIIEDVETSIANTKRLVRQLEEHNEVYDEDYHGEDDESGMGEERRGRREESPPYQRNIGVGESRSSDLNVGGRYSRADVRRHPPPARRHPIKRKISRTVKDGRGSDGKLWVSRDDYTKCEAEMYPYGYDGLVDVAPTQSELDEARAVCMAGRRGERNDGRVKGSRGDRKTRDDRDGRNNRHSRGYRDDREYRDGRDDRDDRDNMDTRGYRGGRDDNSQWVNNEDGRRKKNGRRSQLSFLDMMYKKLGGNVEPSFDDDF